MKRRHYIILEVAITDIDGPYCNSDIDKQEF